MAGREAGGAGADNYFLGTPIFRAPLDPGNQDGTFPPASVEVLFLPTRSSLVVGFVSRIEDLWLSSRYSFCLVRFNVGSAIARDVETFCAADPLMVRFSGGMF